MAGLLACKDGGDYIASLRGMLILSSFPTLPLSGKRLTGFGTQTIPSEDGIRLPQFHRASPSTALDKKCGITMSYFFPRVKAASIFQFTA